MKMLPLPNKAAKPAKVKRRSGKQALLNPALLWERILVPLDFSACSEKALHYAATLAKQFKASLVLLHVFELYPIDYVLGLTIDNEESKRLLARAEAELVRLSHQYASGRRWGIHTMVRLGKPYQEIVKAARERRVGLVIMGTHGYTGFLHFQLGSTAERVVRSAPCPVLVVREPERERVDGDDSFGGPRPKRENL
jgi:nucleotide-binding universal stress UspA family protein